MNGDQYIQEKFDSLLEFFVVLKITFAKTLKNPKKWCLYFLHVRIAVQDLIALPLQLRRVLRGLGAPLDGLLRRALQPPVCCCCFFGGCGHQIKFVISAAS